MNLRDYLAEIGKRGGSAKSARKTAAAIANGKRGGRPKSRTVSELAMAKKS